MSDFTFIWDMFGFLLHNLKTYQVILHLLTLCLSIQAIQMYKQTRSNSLKSLNFIPNEAGPLAGFDDDGDKKSDDRLMRSVKKRFAGSSERGRTIGSGVKSTFKATIVERIREKTMELRNRQQNESSIMMVARINYKDFSP